MRGTIFLLNIKDPPVNHLSIGQLKQLPPQQLAKYDPYLKVAKGMDANFLNFLITKMRESIDKEKDDGQEVKYYTSLLDHEYAKLMAEQNEGKGVQEIILDQILPHYLQNRINQNNARNSIKIYQKAIQNRPLYNKNNESH